MTPLFIWLGSGRGRKRGVAEEGCRLDAAAAAGLPVPPGAILPDDFFRFNLAKGLARREGTGYVIPDAELWHNTLFYSVRLPRFERPVVVRAIGARDNPREWAAIALNDVGQAARAFERVWSAATGDLRHDALIMETFAAEHSGIAISRDEEVDDLLAVRTRAGLTEPCPLPRLRGRARPTAGLPDYACRLQQLLRGARRTFGRGDWAIRWADDGRVCWLMGVDAPRAG